MLFLILFLFLFDGELIFCQNELRGFRNAPWGSSIKEVRSLETANYMQSFSGFGIYALSYKSSVAGLEAWIDYTFIDEKLVEGSYLFEPVDSYKHDFNKLKDLLISEFGKPDFKAGLDSLWVKENEYGKFKGPEFYWQFHNGFVALVASKYQEKITLIILYSSNKTIEEYNSGREISVESFSNF